MVRWIACTSSRTGHTRACVCVCVFKPFSGSVFKSCKRSNLNNVIICYIGLFILRRRWLLCSFPPPFYRWAPEHLSRWFSVGFRMTSLQLAQPCCPLAVKLTLGLSHSSWPLCHHSSCSSSSSSLIYTGRTLLFFFPPFLGNVSRNPGTSSVSGGGTPATGVRVARSIAISRWSWKKWEARKCWYSFFFPIPLFIGLEQKSSREAGGGILNFFFIINAL
jgi:hypothetical protein